MRVCIVGAGFSGAVIARQLAEHGIPSVVVDERSHVAGNCHTSRDPETGVMVHQYGPHIFHTSIERVWNFISTYGEMMPYVNRVKANVGRNIYSLPINLHTINQFFGKDLNPKEAKEFIDIKAMGGIEEPISFEEQALKFVGDELYRAFFKGYTTKQWGISPTKLPASILKRLPLRFNYNDNYFDHKYQAIPRDGYTSIISNILNHEKIIVMLGIEYEQYRKSVTFDHLFYTGPIDRYFHYIHGRLAYRTLDFERLTCDGDFQGVAVMNYPDEDVKFTRITEHKHFAPWEACKFSKSVVFKEYSRACGASDIPYYPINLIEEQKMLLNYQELASRERNVTFVGRLGTYQYLDMDVTIDKAIDTAEKFMSSILRL